MKPSVVADQDSCSSSSDLIDELDRLILMLARRIRGLGGVEGLTPVEWKILIELSRAEHLSLTELARAAALTKGSVSRSLRSLKGFDLVQWHRSADRYKAYVISVTPQGQKACESAHLRNSANSPFRALGRSQREVAMLLLTLAADDSFKPSNSV